MPSDVGAEGRSLEAPRVNATNEIRDCIVFALHSVLRDPPLSKLNLVSCRNILIYHDRSCRAAGTDVALLRAQGRERGERIMATYVEATNAQIRSRIKGASSVNLVLGLWLIAAPFVLAFTSSAFVNDILCGIAIVILAGLRVHRPTLATKPASWVNLAIGAWLVVAPFVLGYLSGAAAWNDIVVGILVLMFAGWSGTEPRVAAKPVNTRSLQ